MKPSRHLRFAPIKAFTVSLLIIQFAGPSIAATSQFWNAGNTGGDGIWGTGPGDKNWNLIAGAPAGNTTWPDTGNDVAVFQDAIGGTVTVFDPVQAAGISQTGANYTINAGTITLVQDSGAANPSVNVQTGALTIDSVLAGSNGLIKSGAGNLLLTSANTFTGTTSVSAGDLTLTGTLASSSISIASGANLLDQSGGLAAVTDLANAGTLSINATEIIGSLTNNAGIVNGNGSLTVTGTTTFNGGTLAAPLTITGNGGGTFTNASIAGTFNGSITLDGATVSGTVSGNITSTGNTLISGTIGGGSLSVTGGTLTLAGTSTHTPVDISESATLIDSNSGLDSTSILTNTGILTVSSADSIASYTQNGNGSLTGAGPLTVTGGATLNSGTVSGNLLGYTTSTGNVLISGSIGGGSLSITNGTLNLAGTSTNHTVEILAPATLIDSGGGLDSTAILTNAGILTVNAADSITSYTQNGNGSLTGNGALTATGGATLNGGTVSGNLFGNTTSTSNLLVSGSLGGGTLSLTGGTLTLSGTSTNATVDISAPAILIDGNGGLGDSMAITNAGTLTVNAADTVSTYTQNGGGTLSGTAALIVTSGATLNGGSVSGILLGNTTSTGNVDVSGILGAGSLAVTAGTLNLTGTTNNFVVGISDGATLVDAAGGLHPNASITNAGTLRVDGADVVSTYVQLSNGLLSGSSSLTVSGGALLNGGTVAGTLYANIVTDGNVEISGKVGLGSLSILNGNLVLSGKSESNSVAVSAGSSLLDSMGGLDSASLLTNSGTVTINANDHVRTYVSSGGTLAAGAGVLSTVNSLLYDGTSIAGQLTTAKLISIGNVSVSGSVTGQSIDISSGTLTNTGTLGSVSSWLNINSGATLVAGGRQHFGILTTSGSETGIWRGNLRNPSVVAPGNESNLGKLRVDGSFSQSRVGILQFDLSNSGHDSLEVTGKARFNGTLDLHQLGDNAIAPFVPIQLVDASSYAGNFTTLSENLDGAVWFNPVNGTVVMIPSNGAPKHQFPRSTENQVSSWISLYDDVIEPGVTNITKLPGGKPGYQITSGIADDRNEDLMWALEASYTPSGLNSDLLNRLSAEVYASFNDYAVQATRSHMRAALAAPALSQPVSTGDAKSGVAKDSKNPETPSHTPRDWEFFAAADYLDASTDNSLNQADYGIHGSGFLTGARTHINPQTLIAGYVAIDAGSIDGELIDSDETGWSLGIFCRTVLDERSQTILTAALSHGRYEFDGSRESVIADASGWRPGETYFSNVNSFSTELLLGVESQFQPVERLRLIPSANLRGSIATMDDFSESSGTSPGSPIALSVERDNQDYLVAELGLTAQTDINAKLLGWAHVGYSLGLKDDPHVLQAAYVQGSRPMRNTTEGLSNDFLNIGLGAEYKLNESVAVGVGYYAELHPGESTLQGFNLSTSFRF